MISCLSVKKGFYSNSIYYSVFAFSPVKGVPLQFRGTDGIFHFEGKAGDKFLKQGISDHFGLV